MNLILHSLNYSPELTGIGKYNGEMCPELVKRALDVTAIVAPPYYPEWQVHQSFNAFSYQKQTIEGVGVVRCPLYVPKNVTTIKRIIHLASFAVSSAFALTSRIFNKPDVIMLVQPTLFCAPFTLLFAKLTGAKAVMHIQDFEVDALFGLGMMGDGVIARFAKRIESWLMKRFDAVSTISFSMIENAKRKGVAHDKIIHFPNWSDTEFVTPNTDGATLKAEWGFTAQDKVILYAGNIGNKQGLEIVLDAAKYFAAQTHIKFVLVGAGAYVDTLKANAANLQLSNVVFKPLQPWEKVPQMLALADIHLVVQKKGAADAVLPSKLTNILSAGGHALVTAEADTELGKIALNHPDIYTCVEPENPTAFIQGLEALLAKNLVEHNQVARHFAENHLAKDKIIDQFVSDLTQLVNK
ncbi:WcaI family glycosyltransferase [Shewanella vesiculosa]|uniref:WcaI family glycosyltransferase n=1 Tax=Shewanella vesiculosa TaxID=518738 RepID=UPI00384DB921